MKPSQYIRKGWCKGVGAKLADGSFTRPEDPMAVQWCTYGAISAAYPYDFLTIAKITTRAAKYTGTFNIAYWNDQPSRTKQQVVKLLESIGE